MEKTWVGGCLAVLGWGLVGFVVSGCGGDDSPPPSNRSHEEAYCDAVCETTARCLYPVISNCTQLCVEDNYYWLSRMDPEAAEAVAECMLDRPCSEVEEWEHELSCQEEVAATLPPSETLVDFCECLSPVWFNCGYWADLGWCVEEFRLVSESILESAQSCGASELSCEETDECISSVFGG